MRRAIGYRYAALSLTLACLGARPADAQAGTVTAACAPSMVLDDPIARASRRFAIPETLVRTVIAVESAGLVHAVSPKGAMGLMQLMPGTWAELRQRYALGRDPFDPCDNILAGTAYLRELLDRYGDPGFLAAYNAGPGRYEAYLAGRPLPAETLAYVARISSRVMGGGASVEPRSLPDPEAWRGGELFVRPPAPPADRHGEPSDSLSFGPQSRSDLQASEPARDSVFVPRTGVPK